MFGDYFNYFLNTVKQIFNVFKSCKIMGNITYFDFLLAGFLIIILFEIFSLLHGGDDK